jgi:nucleoside-diphosphate-sugar epimerase
MDQLSLFGKGFIGSLYNELYPCFVQPRNCKVSVFPDILYFTSTTHNYNLFTDPHLDINTNLNLLVDVLEEARKGFGKDTVFNFISSWFVYGGSISEYKSPFCSNEEDAVCHPKGFYSITKHAAEQLLISYCQTYGMSYRILRLANVLGESDYKCSLKKNATQYLIREIVCNRDIAIYDEDSIRDYIYVDDACKAIHLVLEKGNLNEIYNISNQSSISVQGLLTYVMGRVDYQGKLTYTHSDFHDVVGVKSICLDNYKIRNLGYELSLNIYQMVDKIIQYYQRENGR